MDNNRQVLILTQENKVLKELCEKSLKLHKGCFGVIECLLNSDGGCIPYEDFLSDAQKMHSELSKMYQHLTLSEKE